MHQVIAQWHFVADPQLTLLLVYRFPLFCTVSIERAAPAGSEARHAKVVTGNMANSWDTSIYLGTFLEKWLDFHIN